MVPYGNIIFYLRHFLSEHNLGVKQGPVVIIISRILIFRYVDRHGKDNVSAISGDKYSWN
jgi:hypothetical protein